MTIHYLSRFKREYKKLSRIIQLKAEKAEQLFRANPFDPRLHTHKLHGALKDQWSFSIDNNYRVLFEFDGADVIFIDVGDHELYK